MGRAEGLVLDLDGTVYFGDDPIPGAAETIEHLYQSIEKFLREHVIFA